MRFNELVSVQRGRSGTVHTIRPERGSHQHAPRANACSPISYDKYCSWPVCSKRRFPLSMHLGYMNFVETRLLHLAERTKTFADCHDSDRIFGRRTTPHTRCSYSACISQGPVGDYRAGCDRCDRSERRGGELLLRLQGRSAPGSHAGGFNPVRTARSDALALVLDRCAPEPPTLDAILVALIQPLVEAPRAAGRRPHGDPHDAASQGDADPPDLRLRFDPLRLRGPELHRRPGASDAGLGTFGVDLAL